METKYVLLTFTSHDQILKMGCGEVLKINSLDGFIAPPYTIHTQSNATEDGTTETGSKVDERVLKIEFTIDNLLNPEFVRRKLMQFFNPKYEMKLTANYMYLTRWITGKVSGFKVANPDASMYDYQKYVLEILCTDPFWNSPDNYGKNIASITKMWSYPLTFVTFNNNSNYKTKSQLAGYRTLSRDVLLSNTGDVPTGLMIKVTAKRGAVLNPKITLVDTGDFIEIIHEMEMGDTILVNTVTGKKAITLIKAGSKQSENIFKEKNKLSTFFQLELGDNWIQYDAEEGYTNLDVRVYYTPQYLGV